MENTRDRERATDRDARNRPESELLVELAPEEAVVRALSQSAHPIEWAEAHKSDKDS
jgi:hypothetical protein